MWNCEFKHMSNHSFCSQGSSESHVCKICPGRTFFSPIPSPTAAPIYFVHFRKVQVLNLGRKSNQSAIWSKRFQTQDEHSKGFFCSLASILLKNIYTELIFYYKFKKMIAPVFQSNEKTSWLKIQVPIEGVSIAQQLKIKSKIKWEVRGKKKLWK